MPRFIALAVRLVVLAITVLFVAVCSNTGSEKTEVTVAVAKAAVEDLSSDLSLTAELRPFQEIEVMAKVALATGSKGGIKTETLRAFTEDEYRKIIASLP